MIQREECTISATIELSVSKSKEDMYSHPCQNYLLQEREKTLVADEIKNNNEHLGQVYGGKYEITFETISISMNSGKKTLGADQITKTITKSARELQNTSNNLDFHDLFTGGVLEVNFGAISILIPFWMFSIS